MSQGGADPTIAELNAILVRILSAAGASEANARIVADHLLEAELAGRESHGVRLIGLYVDRLLDGQVCGTAVPTIRKDLGAAVALSGNQAFGQVVGDFAAEIGVARAREHGVSLLMVENSGHFGRNARWPEYAARHGVASIHFGHGFGTAANVIPFGSVEPKLRTSPIAIGVPSDDGKHVIIDFSVAEVSGNVARLAFERGERLLSRAVMGPDGIPTDDPAGFVNGDAGLLTFGGFKGYGLAVFAQIFAGIIAGGAHKRPGTNSLLSLYFDVRRLIDWDMYNTELAEFLADLRSARPAPGIHQVVVPGDRSHGVSAKRREQGLEVTARLRDMILDAAGKAGIAQSVPASLKD